MLQHLKPPPHPVWVEVSHVKASRSENSNNSSSRDPEGNDPHFLTQTKWLCTPNYINNQRVLACNSKSNNPTILYYNAGSLLPKINELMLLAETNCPSVVCVVETWLWSDILDNELFISNYTLVGLDRNRNRGGILMFISANLKFSVFPFCDGFESPSVVVSNELSKSCISFFHRPPSSSSLHLDSLFYILNRRSFLSMKSLFY